MFFNVAQYVLVDNNNRQLGNTPSTEPWAQPNGVIISSADVSNPELTPESSPGEAARIHAALGHPFFSNHPTQTAPSGIGDVVIGNGRKEKNNRTKRWLLIGLFVVIILLTTGLIIWGEKKAFFAQ